MGEMDGENARKWDQGEVDAKRTKVLMKKDKNGKTPTFNRVEASRSGRVWRSRRDAGMTRQLLSKSTVIYHCVTSECQPIGGALANGT